MYRAKGTAAGHELFFRLLFNEKSETIYPREQLLKTSDGQYDSLKILRIIERVGNTEGLISRTITGKDSRATAVIENLARFQIGDDTITELVLNQESVNGTFQVGEEVSGTASETETEMSGVDPDARAGRIDSATLLNLRAGYEINDNYKLVAGVNNLTDLEYVSSRHPAGARAGKPLSAWVKAVANFDSIFSK